MVAATGPFQKPSIPPVIAQDAGPLQIHSNAYRNPAQLPKGAVLVVGGGSSGVQIAEELMKAGRRVFLSIGPHDRPPRRYRGRDNVWWLGVLGKWNADSPGPGTEHVTIAVSGAGLDIGSGFSNAGLLDVDAAMSISAPDFQNSGTLDLNDTLIVANMTNAVGGTVQGNGTIVTPSNPLTNAGRLSPGNSPGLLTINGDLVMLPTSIVDFELNDITQPGINYDSIVVTGTATLAGTLDVTLAPGFFPAPGTQIPDVVTYTTVVNDFQIINGPVVPAEQQFSGGDVGGVSYTLLAGSIFFPPDPVEVAPTAVAQPVVEAILVLDNNEPAGPEDLLADVADEAQVVLLLGDEGGTEVPLFTNRPPLCAP